MDDGRPLSGIRIVELVGIGPGPFAGQVLADLGAEVIAVSRPGPALRGVDDRGKRRVTLDLRDATARRAVLELCARADALIEGFRPGVAERLGLGPEVVRAQNERLVYGRITGWGQTGPWAHKAGHDINYIGLTGALHAMGEAGRPPQPPLNLVGDYGGGSLFLVAGILAALLRARSTGEGCVVDTAIIDGTASMLGVVQALRSAGLWSDARGANLLDGGCPYYRCYETADGGFMAVGAIEAKFFAEMLALLKIDPATFGHQNDRTRWPEQAAELAATFRTRTRAAWEEVFDASDACVTPVLSMAEAMQHPQNRARDLYRDAAGIAQPGVAPVIGPGADRPVLEEPGASTRAVLEELGLDAEDIRSLTQG